MVNFIVLSILLFLSFTSVYTASQCGTIKARGVNKPEQQEIVNLHNYLRSLIKDGKVPLQPKGKNFKLMKWDETLAKEAQKVANTCVFEHIKIRDSRFYSVGQNLYTRSTSGGFQKTNWSQAINAWFLEHKNFSYPNHSNSVVGHYTQVVWAKSEFIGCGFIRFFTGTSTIELYACNYGPGGNFVGMAPYELA